MQITSKVASKGLAMILASLLLGNPFVTNVEAQTPEASKKLELSIIVVPTMADAENVLAALKGGENFAVLAKEVSTDTTAVDGGYMGDMNLADLRTELRDALRGHVPDDLTDVVHLPSGFAVMKILPTAPPTEDMNPKRVSSLIASGAIRFGAQVGGYFEADTAFQEFPKPSGWNRDMVGLCQAREKSLAVAKQTIERILNSPDQIRERNMSIADQVQSHSALAEMHSYSGDMDKSIAEWNASLRLAETGAPGFIPNLLESLGTSYLHKSEMENGTYAGSSDLDIFPPLHPGTSFERTDDSKKAIEYFEKYLAQQPNDMEVRWLLNLAYATLGQYPSGVPATYRIPEAAFHSQQNIGRFVDIAPAAGLNVFRMAGGVVVDDFDNDGLLDVMVSSMNFCDPIRFFHNNGDGTFTDRTQQAGLMNQLGGLNILQADYNNDGCMDLLILRGGWEFPMRRSLLKNNCDGTFTDVTEQSGLMEETSASQAGVWADVDNDGYLDLFLAREGGPAQLWRNKGDGTFEEIGHAAGIDRIGLSKGVAAADYDHDAYMDFYIVGQNGVNALFHNNGNLTFTEVGRQAGVQSPAFSFATWFFDYDNDGWPDLWVDSYMTSVEEVVKTYVGQPHNAETLKLYRNKHDGTFEDVSAQVGLDKVFMSMGANFGDVDNDGYLDVYLGLGSPSYTALMPHELLRNDGGKSFVDITESSGTGELHKGHGIAFADLSRQGREDIIAEIGGAVPGDKHNMRVFENPGNSNDWLNVKLVGVKTNREGNGARIHVTVRNGDAPERSIYRTVGETSSFGGNPLEQNIGLGPHAHGVTLDVSWPASLTHQHFEDVAPGQYIEIKEFATNYTKLERHPFQLGKSPAASLASTGQKTH